jgi:hypothetical protein
LPDERQVHLVDDLDEDFVGCGRDPAHDEFGGTALVVWRSSSTTRTPERRFN